MVAVYLVKFLTYCRPIYCACSLLYCPLHHETRVVLYTLWTIEQYPNPKLYSAACLNPLIIFFFWSTICIIDLTEHVENCLSKWNFKKFIVLGGIRANCDMKLNLNGVEIERVNENRLLGVTADLKLCWKSHRKYWNMEIIKIYRYAL